MSCWISAHKHIIIRQKLLRNFAQFFLLESPIEFALKFSLFITQITDLISKSGRIIIPVLLKTIYVVNYIAIGRVITERKACTWIKIAHRLFIKILTFNYSYPRSNFKDRTTLRAVLKFSFAVYYIVIYRVTVKRSCAFEAKWPIRFALQIWLLITLATDLISKIGLCYCPCITKIYCLW